MNLLALVTRLNNLESQFAYQTKVVPASATGVNVTCGVGATMSSKGAYVEVIAASGVTTKYRPMALVINLISGVDEYEIDLATGGAGSEVIVSTHKFAANAANAAVRIELSSIADVAKNVRFAARIGCTDSSGRTIKLSLEYIDNQP